ncbi:MAG: hypothetical protein JSV19_08785 [Phycisphaerales bacterium]|nr:MAG: hypothetical protein JSV19_08785 [Phycisphaerales bacterium]
MTESDAQTVSPQAPRRRSTWLPIALVVAIIGAYWLARGGSAPLPGWHDDLDAALADAKSTDRPVLVFFGAPG